MSIVQNHELQWLREKKLTKRQYLKCPTIVLMINYRPRFIDTAIYEIAA